MPGPMALIPVPAPCLPMSAALRFRARALWAFGTGLMLAGLLVLVWALGLLLWQCITWLETSVWLPLPARLAFIDQAQLQAPNLRVVLEVIPELPSAWLSDRDGWRGLQKLAVLLVDRVHIGVPAAALAYCAIAAGNAISLPQVAALHAEKERTNRRLRRAQAYRA